MAMFKSEPQPISLSLFFPSIFEDHYEPGESQGQRSLVGCRLWRRTESDTTDTT